MYKGGGGVLLGPLALHLRLGVVERRRVEALNLTRREREGYWLEERALNLESIRANIKFR